MDGAVHRLHRRRARGTAPGRSPRPWSRRRPARRRRRRSFCATAPGLSVAFSSSATMSAVPSLAFGPSSHSMTSAASPFFAAPIWSATTATASSSCTTWRTPLTAFAARVVDALHASAEDGRLRERRELHAGRPDVDAEDRRAVDLRRRVEPLGRRADQLKSSGSLSRRFSGTGSCAASAASSP